MASLIDLVISIGLFFVFVALIMSFVLTYYSNFLGVLQDSELRTSAANVNNIFYGGKGVPEDWETRNSTPARIGLLNDMYKVPLLITVTNSTPLTNSTINFTLSLDPSCLNRTRESTIRIYNETNHEHPYTLYNKTFCVAGTFLKTADVAMNVTLPAQMPRTFHVYFSPETGINSTSYGTIAFTIMTNRTTQNVTNYTVAQYPTETVKMISPSKLRALRNLTYSQIAQSLGGGIRFELEVDSP